VVVVVAAAAVLVPCFGRPPFFLHSSHSRTNPNFRSSRTFVFPWDFSLHYPDGQSDRQTDRQPCSFVFINFVLFGELSCIDRPCRSYGVVCMSSVREGQRETGK
jgi:hypothetical protein